MADSDWRSLSDGEFSETVTLEEWRRGQQTPEPELKPVDRPTPQQLVKLFNYAPAWMAEAACRTADPRLFFGSKGDNLRADAAKAICIGCDHRAACLEYVMDATTGMNVDFGVWGGTTPNERRIIRRHRKAAA